MSKPSVYPIPIVFEGEPHYLGLSAKSVQELEAGFGFPLGALAINLPKCKTGTIKHLTAFLTIGLRHGSLPRVSTQRVQEFIISNGLKAAAAVLMDFALRYYQGEECKVLPFKRPEPREEPTE